MNMNHADQWCHLTDQVDLKRKDHLIRVVTLFEEAAERKDKKIVTGKKKMATSTIYRHQEHVCFTPKRSFHAMKVCSHPVHSPSFHIKKATFTL